VLRQTMLLAVSPCSALWFSPLLPNNSLACPPQYAQTMTITTATNKGPHLPLLLMPPPTTTAATDCHHHTRSYRVHVRAHASTIRQGEHRGTCTKLDSLDVR
jgi:hypothetical protein